MKSDYQYLFPEILNLWKVTSVGPNFVSPASLDINSQFKKILPIAHKMNEKNIQVVDGITRCRKVIFFRYFQMVAGSYYLVTGYEVRLPISLLGVMEPLKSYLRRLRRYKIGADGGHFRGSKSPKRDIGNLTSYPAPRELYNIIFKN